MSQPHPPMSNLATCSKGMVPSKPKRPLTAFNLFSILERSYILEKHQETLSDGLRYDIVHDPYVATRPERYRNVVLPSDWYIVGTNKTNKGKRNNNREITFEKLSAAISHRWRWADAETKLYCEMIAANEFKRYREDLAAYEEFYGKDATKAQRRMHKNLSQNNDTADEGNRLSFNEQDERGESDETSQHK